MALCMLVLALTLATGAEAQAWNETRPWALRTRVRTEALWRRSEQPAIAGLVIGGEPLLALPGFRALLDWPFLLPRTQLAAGVGYAGARTRLRRFVRDLLSGRRQLKIGVVGGSVSWGQGASLIGQTDWFSVLARWMISAFPAANITARNGAVPATPSAYMVMCLELSVDPDVDLVFVEYGLNDGYEDAVFHNGVVASLERLLRRLLALPGRPAVVVVQVPMYGIAMEAADPQWRPFWFTSEDVDASLSHYYDVPYLSLRTALYRLAAHERAPGWAWNNTFSDFHPGDAGFRAMADLVVWALQGAALELAAGGQPWGPDEAAALAEPLPPPMVPGNAPPNATMCVVGEGLQALVVAAAGWEWRDEGGGGAKRKAGFVANWSDPSASPAPPRLVLALDTRRGGGGGGGGGGGEAVAVAVAVHVLHLRSYEHMGRAALSCVAGCSCAPLTVDAHMERRVSQTYLARLNVTQAERCEVAVEVLPDTSSGQRKFKVCGVVVADTPAAAAVMERMADGAGWWQVGRFHTGELPLAEYSAAAAAAGGAAATAAAVPGGRQR